ncbi:MAG: sensor histidine kinase [Methylococcales bacterium]
MKSLQLRLSISLLISLICVFLALWWLTSNTIRSLAEQSVTEHLQHDAQSILRALQIDADNSAKLDLNQIEPIYTQLFSGSYYQIVVNNQVIRSTSLDNHELTIPNPPIDANRILYQTGPQQQPLLILANSYTVQGRIISIAVAENLSPTLARINTFQFRYSMISLLLLFILIAMQSMILRSAFHPLRRVQNQIRALDQGEIWQLDPNVPQELSALVTEVNWLLQTLDKRLQRSRHAVADLAHALKTPLTVLQQLKREPAFLDEPELCQSLHLQTTNMQRMIDRVLKRARLAGSGTTKLKFNINQELPALIKAVQHMHRDKHLTIEYNAPPTGTLPIDREDMLELAGNLLDNACKWANATIRLTLTVGNEVSLIIEDDGPGVSEQHIELLANRGARLDEEVDGSGLGLSIAKLITEQHNGQLSLSRSDKLGGFCVEAILRLF